MFIQEDKNRALWGTTLGIAAGLLLGGAAASVENQACTQSANLPHHCLTETPQMRVGQGMLGGAFASGGALLMIQVWGRLQHKE